MKTVVERVDRLEKMFSLFMEEMLEFKQEMRQEMKEFKDEMLAFKEEMRREMKEFKDEMLAFKEEMKAFKDEMLAFKEEMKAFKDEMKAFKDEMLAFKEEMKAFKDEMLAFKEEMKEFKDRMEKEVKRINRDWGALALKFGTLVEDIVIPNMFGVAEDYFGYKEEPDFFGHRLRKKNIEGTKSKEFDVVLAYKDAVFVNETKSEANSAEDLYKFINFIKSGLFFEYFPEFKDKEIIPIFASLYIEDKYVDILTENRVYALGMRDDVMGLINFDNIKKVV